MCIEFPRNGSAPLQLQQGPLTLQSRGVASQSAVGGHHSMTGGHNGQGVPPARLPHRPRAPGTADKRSHLSVGALLSERNGAEGFPHPALKGSPPAGIQGKRGKRRALGEIPLQRLFQAIQNNGSFFSSGEIGKSLSHERSNLFLLPRPTVTKVDQAKRFSPGYRQKPPKRGFQPARAQHSIPFIHRARNP